MSPHENESWKNRRRYKNQIDGQSGAIKRSYGQKSEMYPHKEAKDLHHGALNFTHPQLSLQAC